MDLRQLAALVAVADHGTFSAAADALHTVQSNVSSHVANLEKELGATLVDRAAGRLTAEGVAVVERARRVQAELAALVADVGALRSDLRGQVRLGVLGTTGRWLVPRLVTSVADAHPGIALIVAEGTSATLEPQLVSGAVDLALLTLPLPSPELAAEPLFDEELLLIAPLSSPLAGRDRIRVQDLDGVELLLPAPGTNLRRELDQVAAETGITLWAKAELDGVRLLASLCFEGWACGIVPASAVPSWLRGPWRAVGVDGLPLRQIGLATRARGLASAPAKAVAACLTELIGDVAGNEPGIHLVWR
ncbi:MAG TPA: LysR family transcriptional regulator [Acidimicrobiales bacterium]|nr:LysR family transcriptional regulator [Acidimicrobiales bacterium]